MARGTKKKNINTYSPSKHSFTLIENDKSIQINQTIWRMLRVGTPNIFFKRTTTCQKARQGLKGGRVASV